MPVKKGDKIKIEYVGTLDDGTEFDNSEKHGKPLEFIAGNGVVIKGMDNAVMDMEIGDEKEVKIKPEEGYGHRNPEMMKEIPRDKMPQDVELKPGMMIGLQLPNGQQMPVSITKVDETTVTIDLNPPLAGKNLNFKIKLVEITEGTEDAKEDSVAPASEEAPATKPEVKEEPAKEDSVAPASEEVPATEPEVKEEPAKEEKKPEE